jgi:hypothetical protein
VTRCGALRDELGVYAVGALRGGERAAVDRHLETCSACRSELDELRGVSSLLTVLTVEEAERGPVEAGGAGLDRLLARVAAERRRARRWRVLAVAAAVVVLAGAALGGYALTRDEVPQASAVTTASATGDSGVRIDLAMTRRDWGTALTIDVANVSPGHTCALVAVGQDGVRETAATWTVPSGGYLDRGGKQSLTLDGAVGLHPAQIQYFEVVTPEGEKLVTVRPDTKLPTT